MCVALGKTVLFFAILLFQNNLLKVGEFIIQCFGLENRPKMQLIFVMIIVPVVLNSIQYWIQDSYIKADDKDLED